jgi:3-mercaptopyruvate sulfurtransferase SseA
MPVSLAQRLDSAASGFGPIFRRSAVDAAARSGARRGESFMRTMKIALSANAVARAGRLAAAGADGARNALVSTDWLAASLADPRVRVVEIAARPGGGDHAAIPGAATIAWHGGLVDPDRRAVIGREDFERLAARLGIADGTTVVLYGEPDNWFAAWSLWLFGAYGVRDVRLLDGGRGKWLAERRRLDAPTARPASGRYSARRVNTTLRARLVDMLDVVDGRLAGHAPLALDRGAHVVYREPRRRDAPHAVVYCRLGSPASHTWFALSALLDVDPLEQSRPRPAFAARQRPAFGLAKGHVQ